MMDFEKEAQAIREEQPAQTTFNPPPLPYVGHISLIRRRDGGYVVAAIGADDQAGMLNDGNLAVEILDREAVQQAEPDRLAAALEQARDNLMRLRLESALRLAAKIGRELSSSDDAMVAMLRDALENKQWE